jgi:hypothetical protein
VEVAGYCRCRDAIPALALESAPVTRCRPSTTPARSVTWQEMCTQASCET